MESESQLSASFIIPALNEEKHIARVLDSIISSSNSIDYYEIIVVDNGSTDNTVSISKSRGAHVLEAPGVTVGSLRNLGAMKARYSSLIFIDADVHLTLQWWSLIGETLKHIYYNEKIITGSFCSPSLNSNWIERCWWNTQHINGTHKSYINSGHLIVSRRFFWEIGGFSPNLKTGEDVEFCERAKVLFANIRNNQALKVIHEGYPKTISDFFSRERWHGLGDYTKLHLFVRSKPAILATFQMILFIVCFLDFIATGRFISTAIYIFFIFLICIGSAYRRTRSLNTCLLINSCLFFFYFWARAISLFDFLSTYNPRKMRR